MAGGGGDVEGVPGAGAWSGGPAGEFFGVVAGFAESGAVVPGGGAVVVPGDDVVEVADGCVAVRGAAGVVAGLDKAAEPGREEPGAGVQGGEVAGAGGGVEPAEPDVQVLVPGAVPGSRRPMSLPVLRLVLAPASLPAAPVAAPFPGLVSSSRAQPAGTMP